jgi:asparagine synthase (glutamine-hydrolysing)
MTRQTDAPSVIGHPQLPANELSWRFQGEGIAAGGGWRVACIGFVSNLAELGGKSESPRPTRHSEALLQLLERHGSPILYRLKGNFVVLAECRRSHRFFAVRDRLGGRTCYYSKSRDAWCFAPSATAVLALSGLPAEVDRLALIAHFAVQAPPPGRTVFLGVHELRPGELLEIDAAGSRSRWLDWPESCLDDYSDATQAVAVFRRLLDTAVGERLSPDGPVGCMLSGGMDSGPIAEAAHRQLKERGRKLLPFSWSVPAHPGADEAGWIRMLCAHLDLHPCVFEPVEGVLDDLDQNLIDPDWPAFNPYRKLMETCYRMAGEAGCRVILNGNAGDDLYVPIHILYRAMWQQGDASEIWRDLRHVFSRGGIRAILEHPPFRHVLGRLRPGRRARPPSWLTAEAAAHWRAIEASRERFDWHPLPALAKQLLGPRMTRGRAHEQYFALRNGVERRDPYHDEDLVGFMLHAPASLSIRDGRSKWIMREAMKGRLPERFRLKARTGVLSPYFAAGLEANRDAVEDLLFRENTDWQEWVDPDTVQKAVSGEQPRDTLVIRCIGYVLWRRHWKT